MSPRKIISVHNCTQYKPGGRETLGKVCRFDYPIQQANEKQVKMANFGRINNVKILRKMQGELSKGKLPMKRGLLDIQIPDVF